jgi:ubiquinone/menaquinone biosynthesis C-methylase UbiE
MKDNLRVTSDTKQNIEKYEERYIHFDFVELPKMLKKHLMAGPLGVVDLGCGDGPWFNLLHRHGYISESRPVYAVDLDNNRLERIVSRFPWISVIVSSAESVPQIPDQSVDFVISTMVMEHVFDEGKYLLEIRRILKPDGKAFITTVYKRKWALFYRRRNGEFVLDTSHVREYTDLDAFKKIITANGLEILDIKLVQLKIPVMKPVFRIWKRRERSMNLGLRLLLWPKFPVPGYYELELVVRYQA